MSVDTFDPSASPGAVSEADLALLLRAAQSGEETPYGLSDHEVARLARLVRSDGADWETAATSLADNDVEAVIDLIRLLVRAESTLPGWDSGARSPVIVLANLLKQRNAYPADLTSWIKAHSSNRFLPYGSLLDRL